MFPGDVSVVGFDDIPEAAHFSTAADHGAPRTSRSSAGARCLLVQLGADRDDVEHRIVSLVMPGLDRAGFPRPAAVVPPLLVPALLAPPACSRPRLDAGSRMKAAKQWSIGGSMATIM